MDGFCDGDGGEIGEVEFGMMKSFLLGLFVFVGLLGVTVAEEVAGQYEVTYEVFSLPLAEAAKLRRERLGGVKSHARLVDGVEKGVVRQERWMVLKVRDDDWWISKEVEEFVYGTEYDPGDGLNSDPVAPAGSFFHPYSPLNSLVPFVHPEFDTKYIGDIFECEVEGSKIRMKAIHLDHLLNDSFGKGLKMLMMPRFSVQYINTTVAVTLGKPVMVGTISPPGELQDEEEKRVWLAFVTVVKL